MNKRVLASSLSLLAAGFIFSAPAKSEILTTGALVEMCQATDNVAAQNFCHGFNQGVYDTYVASRHPDNNPPFICFPDPGPTRGTVIDNFVDWAENNPQFTNVAAADTVLRYLAGTYACQQ